MSDHVLPSDPSSWPKDPYRLLGVERGTSPRDLRRAYLRLIRAYKPEHAPEEFRRIREAYETALQFAERYTFTPSPPEDDERDADTASADDSPRHPIETEDEPGVVDRRPIRTRIRNPWGLACEGDALAAYRALCESSMSGRSRGETYIQMYWLLVIDPDLDPSRSACDVLVDGLKAVGASARVLCEPLKREAEASPEVAVSDRLLPLLNPGAPVNLLSEITSVRWRAAIKLSRWNVIIDDIRSLRTWVASEDHDVWARLLIAAAGKLVWANRRDRNALKFLDVELKAIGRNSLDFSDPLFLLDQARELDKGLRRLNSRIVYKDDIFHSPDLNLEFLGFIFPARFRRFTSGFRQLLALSWDDPDQEALPLIRAHIELFTKNPRASLRALDFVHGAAPLVLNRLTAILDSSGLADDLEPIHDNPASVRSAVEWFLARNRWWRYSRFRHRLLKFCVRELISPASFVHVTTGRPEYSIPVRQSLSQTIAADAPLFYLYRVRELHQG